MKSKKIYVIFLTILIIENVLSFPSETENPDEEDEEWDDEDISSESDDDGKIYKNPRNSPSFECPRDEEQATLLGQKCLRKCSSDEDCKSKKKKCLCDGVCGMSCIKPDRECPNLSQPVLGKLEISGKHFGARAKYSCPPGLHVIGLQSRLCQADGNWAGNEPTCKEHIYCLVPPVIEHARHSALPEQTTFDLDATVQYHCYTGYVTNGFPRAKCLAIDGQASWYGPDVQCEPRSCGQPLDPSNGWHAGECYTFGCKITYHCMEGFELVGKQERSCQADGSWIPKELPTCVLVTSVVCPIPDNPKNGKAIFTTLSYNSVVSYECRYGYTLIGDSSRRCGADKKWSGSLPLCKEINCGHPGVLYNGWIENIDAGTGLGASLIFRCLAEMMLQGYSSSVCQIDGTWRYPIPQCLAPCIVPTVSQGLIVPIESFNDENITTPATFATLSAGKVKHGTTLEVICDEHYEFPASPFKLPTCNNGTWSVIPRCNPARCKVLPKPPKNGMVVAPKTDHGMKARFSCKDGYKMTSSSGKTITSTNEYTLTCSFGIWKGEYPLCQEVYCSFPGYIPNGKVLLVGNMGLYDYRPYVKKIANNKQIMYDCDKGYVLEEGPPGATCVGGKWRPTELPKCTLGQHPRLRWNRKKRSLIKRFLRSKYILNNNRNLKHWDNPMNKLTYAPEIRNLSIKNKRYKRNASNLDIAYSRYYQKIKKKYQHYVKTLLGFNKDRKSILTEINKPNKNLQVQDGRWFNTYNNPNLISKYRVTHKSRTMSDLSNEEISRSTSDNNKVKNNDLWNRLHMSDIKTKTHNNDSLFFSGYGKANIKDNYFSNIYKSLKENTNPEIYNDTLLKQLKAEIVRKKRNSILQTPNKIIKVFKRSLGAQLETPTEIQVCEDLDWVSFSNTTVIRKGKSDANNSYGTIIFLECNPGFQLNNQSYNTTTRCTKGSWKPFKPICSPAPCLVPLSKNGQYIRTYKQHIPLLSETLPSYTEIESGHSISLQCEPGFSVQGSSNMRCMHGSWSVNIFPQCVTSTSCILPNMKNLVYEGGYRSGLTIAHGSSVLIHCDTLLNDTTFNMTCNRGKIQPNNIYCELNNRKMRDEYLVEAEYVVPNASNNFLVSRIHTDVKNDEIQYTNSSEENFYYDNGRNCAPPNRIDGTLVYKNGDELSPEEGYTTGTEIFFNCIPSAAGERNSWKIICEEGTWVGRSFACENGTCLFKNNEPNVVSFFNDLEIREDTVEFPPGATVISRCVDIGKYAMIGNNERTCIHSEWTGTKPACFGLNQENDYAMEKAPTILFRHQNGPISQSNDGKLIVYPGTTVHMECLWMRRFGNPKWNASNERIYAEGWVTDEDEGRDPQLEYRLSIINATEEDSGIFTCQTPARHEHSVEVLVQSINCPRIPVRRGLFVSTNNTHLSSKILLSCANGNSLIGSSELYCLPSGNWSAPLPVCESVECGDILIPSNDSAPRVSVLSREVGGRAAFSCPAGFGLRGSPESICLPTGEWSLPFPICTEVQCENPGAPQNGYAQGSVPYRAGDVVQFNCNPEYMMQGQPIIACQDSGRWSGVLPKCIQACSYPGTTISGRMSSVKFYYAIGESITFTCDAGLDLKGTRMLKCLRNGKWSNTIPTCVSIEGNGNGSILTG